MLRNLYLTTYPQQQIGSRVNMIYLYNADSILNNINHKMINHMFWADFTLESFVTPLNGNVRGIRL